jgi:acetylglutamate kinase
MASVPYWDKLDGFSCVSHAFARVRRDERTPPRARRLRDMSEILVVKLGGTTIADQKQVLEEVAAVARQRPIVLVHGGGKRITEWLERLGVPSRFEGGLRVTDQAALEVAAAVLRGVVNSELVAGLRDLGVDAVGLSGVDGGLLVAERLPNLGLVAHVVGIRRDLLDAILVGDQVPVVAPLARDEDGIVCNVNADDAAAGIAGGLGARQLILMTDTDGVRDADGNKIDTMTVEEAEALIDRGVIKGGMVPKIRAALAALTWDKAEAIIADSSAPHALRRALDDPRFGTRLSSGAGALA